MLKPLAWVKVKTLRREGRILEVLHSGQYKVSVGGLIVLCRESDLTLLPRGPEDEEESLSEKKRKRKAAKAVAGEVSYVSLDLHGMRVEEAMALVDRRVNAAILDGKDALRIVHGKGTGKIKGALHRHLGSLGVVKRYRVDEKNPGVTWVYF